MMGANRGSMLLSQARFDVRTLQTAMETLEEALRLTGKVVPDLAAKAALVAQVYGYLTDGSQDAGTQVLGVLKLIK